MAHNEEVKVMKKVRDAWDVFKECNDLNHIIPRFMKNYLLVLSGLVPTIMIKVKEFQTKE